jgi:2-alkenal reductase
MTDPAKRTDKEPKQPEQEDEALIVTPISIARARHASTRSSSVLDDKTRQVSVTKSRKQTGQSKSVKASNKTDSSELQFGGFNSCFLMILLLVSFLVGGVVGGMAGGGLILWANGSDIAMLQDPPTATPIPSPTPAPAATSTSTPTEVPIPTPAVEDIIAQVAPSVVTVINQQHNNFFDQPEEGRIVGSGVIVDEHGYIATNHHVIENAGILSVVLSDGREVPTELVASDPAEDLAILKVNVPDLKAIHWGDSSTLRPGQIVYAIGSPLGDFPNSVSLGIVSGLNRALELESYVIDGLIQTDAAINRGSSGGPLINAHGEMIGINTFIIRESQERGVAEGIAFTIPANTAKNLLIPWIAAHSGESVAIPVAGETGN